MSSYENQRKEWDLLHEYHETPVFTASSKRLPAPSLDPSWSAWRKWGAESLRPLGTMTLESTITWAFHVCSFPYFHDFSFIHFPSFSPHFLDFFWYIFVTSCSSWLPCRLEHHLIHTSNCKDFLRRLDPASFHTSWQSSALIWPQGLRALADWYWQLPRFSWHVAISINIWWSDSLPHLLFLFLFLANLSFAWQVFVAIWVPKNQSLKAAIISNHSVLSNHSASLKEFCSVATSTQGSMCMYSSKIDRWIASPLTPLANERNGSCNDFTVHKIWPMCRHNLLSSHLSWFILDLAKWGWVKTLVPLVNPKIAGKWMFIHLKMVLIGIDPYPNLCNRKKTQLSAFLVHVSVIAKLRLHRILMKTPKRWQVVWPGYFSCWTSSSPDMWPVTHVTSAYRMNTIYIHIYICIYIVYI